MKIFFAVLVVSSIFLGGCATVQPKYLAYENIHLITEDDLKYEFIDLSGQNDAQEKIQRKQFIKIGTIRYENKFTKENMERVKALAKEHGGDAIIVTRTDFLKQEGILGEIYRYGIEVEVIKYK